MTGDTYPDPQEVAGILIKPGSEHLLAAGRANARPPTALRCPTCGYWHTDLAHETHGDDDCFLHDLWHRHPHTKPDRLAGIETRRAGPVQWAMPVAWEGEAVVEGLDRLDWVQHKIRGGRRRSGLMDVIPQRNRQGNHVVWALGVPERLSWPYEQAWLACLGSRRSVGTLVLVDAFGREIMYRGRGKVAPTGRVDLRNDNDNDSFEEPTDG